MLQHLPILPVVIPLLSGIIMLFGFLNDYYKRLRIFGTVMSAILVLVAATLLHHVHYHGPQVYALGGWEPPFGIALVADRLSVLMVLLTAILTLATQLYGSSGEDKQGRFYHPLIMFQIMGISGAFLTGDLFNLFVFFEVLLIASYALVIHGGGKQKTQANVHYVSLNLAGSALFLFALGILYGTFGTLNMADMQQKAASIRPEDIILAKTGGLLLLAVFGLKSAMLPLHFWLPKAYASAPISVAALFAIMTKVGLYSLWRVHNGVFGADAGELAYLIQPWLWPLALLTLTVGIIATLSSQTLRTLSANLVIVSVGSLLLMVALKTNLATAAGLYYLIHSTIAGAAMFLVAGMIINQRGKAEDRFVPSRPVGQPVLLSGLFFVCAIALIGMPPLSGFIGKAFMMKAALEAGEAAWVWPPILLASLASIIVLGRAGSTIFWRSKGDKPGPISSSKREISSVSLLLVVLGLMVVFGGWLSDYAAMATLDLYASIDLEASLETGAEQ